MSDMVGENSEHVNYSISLEAGVLAVDVGIKKINPKAQIPKYAKDGDAGLDLVATSIRHSDSGDYVEYGTGICLEIPKGFVGLVFSRSSISRYNMVLSNGVGVVDSGYRGEIKLRFRYSPKVPIEFPDDRKLVGYDVGEKIGQLIVIPLPHVVLVEKQQLETSERGTLGFGSTGL